MPLNEIEKAIKDVLSKEQAGYSPEAWNKLKKDLPHKGFPLWAKLGMVASIGLIILGGWFFNQSKVSENKTTNKLITENISDNKASISKPITEIVNKNVKSNSQKIKKSPPTSSVKNEKQVADNKKSENPPVLNHNDDKPKEVSVDKKTRIIKPQVIVQNTKGCTPLEVEYEITKIPEKAVTTWTLTNGNISQIDKEKLIIKNPGTYTLKLQIDCEGYASYYQDYKIEVWKLPTADFEYNIDDNDVLTFNTNTSNTVKWFLNDVFVSDKIEDQQIIETSGDYHLTMTVKNNYGCFASKSVGFEHHVDHKIFAPTAFSPNGDGNNDVFILSYQTKPSYIYTLQVYNLEGKMLFQTNSPNEEGWKGEENSTNNKNKRYLWRLLIKDKKGNTEVKQGSFVQL